MVTFLDMILQSTFPIIATIFIALVIFLITKYLELFIIVPFFEFKKELIRLKVNLLFYKNIFTTSFESESINAKFRDKIINAQNEIRNNLMNITAKYDRLKNRKVILSSKILTEDELKKIEENVLSISNSLVVYFRKNKDAIEPGEPEERKDMVNQTIKIINKYV